MLVTYSRRTGAGKKGLVVKPQKRQIVKALSGGVHVVLPSLLLQAKPQGAAFRGDTLIV